MIRSLWCVLCQAVIIDARTNAVSYVNSIERIVAKKLPVRVPSISLGTLWARTTDGKERLRVRIRFMTPSGDQKAMVDSGEFVMEQKHHRFNILFDGLPLEQEGSHIFIVEYFEDDSWKVAKEIPLEVSLKGE